VGLTIALLSLAGIPPLPGFLGKYLVFALAIKNHMIPFVIVAIITSLIGIYYYFKVIVAMYFKDATSDVVGTISASKHALIVVLILITLAMGILPDYIITLL
jgi:NADH-quinone oxidoreductase subunit N